MQDKVLVIEDSRSFASLLQKLLLENLGVCCDLAETKQQAHAILAEHADQYFAAIVDLNLPDAPKGEATETVVQAGIAAVVFTSTNDQAVKDDLWDRGISDYAHKSGSYSLEYICWIINRLQRNPDVKILVVDNSLVARRSMEKLLKTQRYHVFCADSGEQALSIIEHHPDITVAIIDGNMDGMDGFELASKIRNKHSRDSMEVIGVSSQGGRDISAQFIKSGANDFILKPFIPEEFLCRVNHAAGRIESYEELRALNHTKNQLLGTAAHDIRGPVGAIKTATDYILRRNPKPERQQTLLQMIESSATGLLALLSDLLDVSSIEGGELQLNLSEEDLSSLLSERIQLYLAQAEAKSLQLDSCFDAGVMGIVDPVKIRQVVDNLLTNAIKYSPPGGHIEIYLHNDGQNVEFRVEDSGNGIPEEERQDLFVAFKVLSSKATGGEKATGLGLAIVKNVVEAHGGQICYKQAKLGGAAFCISLPANPG